MRYIAPEVCIENRLKDRPAPKWAAALLVYRDYPSSRQVLQAFGDVRPVRYRMLYNMTDPEFEPFVFEADIAGQTIAIVTRLVWGGPQTAILVEELASIGVGLLLGYGAAGSMDRELPQGSLVVAESALPTDGTSKAYGAPAIQRAEGELVDAAVDSAAQAGGDMKPVCAATVDALYRETPEKIDEFARQGAQIINMETSALYAVSAACGVRSLWCGYITDCLVDGKWDDWYADLGNAAEKTVQTCRNLLINRVCSCQEEA